MKTIEIDNQSFRLTDLTEREKDIVLLAFNSEPSGIFVGYTAVEKMLGCASCPVHLSNATEVEREAGYQLRPKVTAILPDEVYILCRALPVARQKGARTPCLSK